MVVQPVPFKPIVEVLADLEMAAAQVVLAASEREPTPIGELGTAIDRLAVTLWELQTVRRRVDALVGELGAPPLHVV